MDAKDFLESYVLEVESRAELDRLLDAAVESLKPAATKARAGIEVARITAGTYKVSINKGIPYGTSLELWSLPAPDAK